MYKPFLICISTF